MKPPFAFYGGKTRLAPWIVAKMPNHSVYVEPCLGAGAVFFAKPPVEHEVLNDIDGALVNFFTMLRDRPDELIRLCELTPYARNELGAADVDEPDISDLERARRWWVMVNQSFTWARHNRAFWVSIKTGAHAAKTVQRRLERLYLVARRLSGASLECRPAVEVITRFDTPQTLFYVDPPYVKGSRLESVVYRNEMSDDGHRELAAALGAAQGAVMISGYENDLYGAHFAGWYRQSRPVRNLPAARFGGTERAAIEILWSNRPFDRGQLWACT